MSGPIYVVGHNTQNIGDTIQTLALLQQLPGEALFLDRDRIAQESWAEEAFLIANGWWMMASDGDRYHFPPPGQISAFWVGCHFTAQFFQSLNPQQLGYLREQAPIGCRDPATVQLCQSRGIEAVWTGCLSMLLTTENEPRCDQVAVVDISEVDWQQFPASIRQDTIRLEHTIRPPGRVEKSTEQFKLRYTQWLLAEYARSRLVVTSRLHAAFPAMALGTPVVMMHHDPQNPRFGAVLDLLKVYRRGEAVDWNPTVPDLSSHAEPLRNLLREAIRLRANPLRERRYPDEFRS